jgi:hypothetical protein
MMYIKEDAESEREREIGENEIGKESLMKAL